MPEEAADKVNAKVKVKKGRKRRAAGWTLLVLGVVVAAVWVSSRWWSMGWRGQFIQARSLVGVLVIERFGPEAEWPQDGGWFVHRLHAAQAPYRWSVSESAEARWSPPLKIRFNTPLLTCTEMGTGVTWQLVLWPIPLLLWTPAALLLRSGILARRRANNGACPKCGYSLAGLGDRAACPECGKGAATT